MGWKLKKKDFSPQSIRHKVDKNLGARDFLDKVGLSKINKYNDQVTAWGDRPLGKDVFNVGNPYAVNDKALDLDFNPDVYLGGVSGTPQGMQGGQGGDMGWLGYEDTPIGQMYGTDFESSPGYQFQLDEAKRQAQQGLSAQGMSNSGAEMKELMRLSQGMAAQDYGRWQGNTERGFGNYLSGLQNMAGSGQNAAVQQGAWAGNAGTNQANLAQQGAYNQAQGTVGQANIYGSGLSQLAQLGGQAWQNYQNQPPPPPAGGVTSGSSSGFNVQQPDQVDALGWSTP